MKKIYIDIDGLIFNRLSLILILLINAIATILYLFLYKDIFFNFLIFLVFVDIVVVFYYLRSLRTLKFEGNKIFYKRFLFRHEFLFSDIASLEKRLVDKMLILKLNNKLKIKIYYLKENYLEDFYNELKKKREDLFILKESEIPIRYYISYYYVSMLLFRIVLGFIVYYISLENILIFIFIFVSTFRVTLNDILTFKKLVIYYEFKKDSIIEKKLLFSNKYYYKFFDKVLIKNENLNNDIYLSFLYTLERHKKIYIKDQKRIYSMQKAFEYVNKYIESN